MALAGGSILEPMGTELSTPAGGARRYRKPLNSFRWCDIRALLSESFSAWIRHNAQRLGAALAFYTLFSITPLLLVVISIAALVLDRTAAEYQIVHEVNDLVGPPGAQAVQALLEGSHHTGASAQHCPACLPYRLAVHSTSLGKCCLSQNTWTLQTINYRVRLLWGVEHASWDI